MVFGGIFEVTKELCDFHVFDTKAEKWSKYFSEILNTSPSKPVDGSPSPSKHLKPGANHDQSKDAYSPMKSKKRSTMLSGIQGISPHRSPMKAKKIISAKKKKFAMTKKEKPDEGLSSPVSVSMKNSFIIKNADQSFDTYYGIMKKRKGHNMSSMHEATYGRIQGKRPAARDGHSGIIFEGNFIVFGGDRHHMPFNDSFMLDFESELNFRGAF